MAYAGWYSPHQEECLYLSQTSFGLSFPNNISPAFFMDQTDKQIGEWHSCWKRYSLPSCSKLHKNSDLLPFFIRNSLTITSTLLAKVFCNTFNMIIEVFCSEYNFLLPNILIIMIRLSLNLATVYTTLWGKT